jgi:hypothetical protein|tara:strand:- start:42 stop:488 length:447 start_codon:yes stop_codon:yes gene_type:complete
MKSILLPFLMMKLSFTAFAADNATALKMALDDEYKAKATYLKVLEDFGKRRPFSRIVRSEQRHIDALIPFFTKYGLTVPDNHYIGNIPSFNSLKDACQAGVAAEIENVELYERIFSLTDDPQLIAVFENLQWASQYRHLPAFKRCARR